MKIPPGCSDLSGGNVLLNGSLYYPKQSARSWHDLLTETHKQKGFERGPSEPCVLPLVDSKSRIIKLIVAGNDNYHE